MPDKTTETANTESPHISDPHRVKTEFVNQVVGSGHLNGVVNLTLATANFTPNADGKIDLDLVIAARLRMDLFCAQQMHEALGQIIAQAMPKDTAH
jgi:hypothetical protein